MLTEIQKNAIMTDIKSLSATGYYVDGVIFTPTVIYDNQLTEKPNFTKGIITLKYIIQTVTYVADPYAFNEYKKAILSINVYGKQYVKDALKINGAIIVQDIARQLINYIRIHWVGGLLEDYRILLLKVGDAQDLTDLVMSNRVLKESIYRNQFDVQIMYRIVENYLDNTLPRKRFNIDTILVT